MRREADEVGAVDGGAAEAEEVAEVAAVVAVTSVEDEVVLAGMIKAETLEAAAMMLVEAGAVAETTQAGTLEAATTAVGAVAGSAVTAADFSVVRKGKKKTPMWFEDNALGNHGDRVREICDDLQIGQQHDRQQESGSQHRKAQPQMCACTGRSFSSVMRISFFSMSVRNGVSAVGGGLTRIGAFSVLHSLHIFQKKPNPISFVFSSSSFR
jgi:hypothetical protein